MADPFEPRNESSFNPSPLDDAFVIKVRKAIDSAIEHTRKGNDPGIAILVLGYDRDMNGQEEAASVQIVHNYSIDTLAKRLLVEIAGEQQGPFSRALAKILAGATVQKLKKGSEVNLPPEVRKKMDELGIKPEDVMAGAVGFDMEDFDGGDSEEDDIFGGRRIMGDDDDNLEFLDEQLGDDKT